MLDGSPIRSCICFAAAADGTDLRTIEGFDDDALMDALRTVNRQDGLTVLACLHHLDAARAWCDRVIALQSGRIVFDGTPAQLSPAKVFDIYGVTEDEFHADHAPLVDA